MPASLFSASVIHYPPDILPLMATASFDTLQAARDIEAAGLDRTQAEAIAQAIRRRGEDYATKADIAALRAENSTIEKAKNAVLLAILAAVGILAGIGLFA